MENSSYNMRNLQKVLQEEGLRGLYRGKSSKNIWFFRILAKSRMIWRQSWLKLKLRLIRVLILNNNRLFNISILHPPVSHHIFPFVWKIQALFQVEIWMERWFIQALLGLSWSQWIILQRRNKSFLGCPHPNASRNIQIFMRSAL